MVARPGIAAHNFHHHRTVPRHSSVMRTPVALPPISVGKEERMLSTRSHPHTFAERLADHRATLQQKAARLKPGPVRNMTFLRRSGR
jgi:hypothetical protein